MNRGLSSPVLSAILSTVYPPILTTSDVFLPSKRKAKWPEYFILNGSSSTIYVNCFNLGIELSTLIASVLNEGSVPLMILGFVTEPSSSTIKLTRTSPPIPFSLAI